MILTTTNSIEWSPITAYKGLVSSEVIIWANVVKDFFAGLTDIFWGRSSIYEWTIAEAKQEALQELEQQATQLGANAIVGIDFDFEVIGAGGSMLMVSVSWTAVTL